jgi:hypothetical protein
MAFCLMQKFVDLKKYGTKVPIISAFSLDHVRGFVFVEAEKACDVTEVRSWILPLKSSHMRSTTLCGFRYNKIICNIRICSRFKLSCFLCE